jgi:hypothetical protein
MSNQFQLQEGMNIIPPEILEELTQKCELPKLTVKCLRMQLDIPELWLVSINGRNITDLETTIDLDDKVHVLPMVEGG